MVTAGWKMFGQAVFLVAGLLALHMGKDEAGYLLLGTACGSLAPVAERQKK
jgi:hypothetical protein